MCLHRPNKFEIYGMTDTIQIRTSRTETKPQLNSEFTLCIYTEMAQSKSKNPRGDIENKPGQRFTPKSRH